MSGMNNERNPHVSIIPIGSLASTTSGVFPGVYFRKRSRIKNVYYADKSAISKSSSNYLTLKLQDNASTPVVYALAATSDNAVVAVTPYAMALQAGGGSGLDSDSATQAEVDVPAGTQLNANVASTLTAIATSAIMIVEWYPL